MHAYVSQRRTEEEERERRMKRNGRSGRRRRRGRKQERGSERGGAEKSERKRATRRKKIEGVHQAKLTLLHSRASALCSSFCLKQLLHLLLLNMFGANFLHSAPVPRTPAVPPDIATRAN